jgi:hypothetical protein
MIDKGLPSFYITINPADVFNPLVKFLAGDEINLDSITSYSVHKYLLIAESYRILEGNAFDIQEVETDCLNVDDLSDAA